VTLGDYLLLVYLALAALPLGFVGWRRLPRAYYAGWVALLIFFVAAWFASPMALILLRGVQPDTYRSAADHLPVSISILMPIGSVLIGTGYVRWWVALGGYLGLGVALIGAIPAEVAWPWWVRVHDVLIWPYWVMLMLGLFGDRMGADLGR
jgi:hypothetical protein